MEKYYYQLQWPNDGLYFTCYVTESMNYHYHWHAYDYELQIVLNGKKEFNRGKEHFYMGKDDVVLINPNTGHASFSTTLNTMTLVVRFSADAFQTLLKKGTLFSFDSCHTSRETCQEPRYRRIRYYATGLLTSAADGGPYSHLYAKGCAELLMASLLQDFAPQVTVASLGHNESQRKLIQQVTDYMEDHYKEKITLEDLAVFSGYNRTYFSTLFKNMTGTNFYDYLMRVRMKYAVFDLTETDKNLTEIALSNGFSDLKSFNKRFIDLFECTPNEYRQDIFGKHVQHSLDRKLISVDNPLVSETLKEYLSL